MKKYFLCLACTVLITCTGEIDTANARIPEPDNIIYGVVADGTQAVSLRINDSEICHYTMGEVLLAADHYILRVPMDSVGEREDGTARPGDMAEIFVDEEQVATEVVTIGEKGTVQVVHLDKTNSDNDCLTDLEEEAQGTNPYIGDSDGDGMLDGAELYTNPLLYDTDGDGYSDGQEAMAGTAGNDGSDMPVIYVDADNVTGIENGTAASPYSTITAAVVSISGLDHYTIEVRAGQYNESVVINKPLHLKGASAYDTVISGGIVFAAGAGADSSLSRFTISGAGVGVDCSSGASPLIRNNIIYGVTTAAVSCGVDSAARIYNNTIAASQGAVGIFSSSADIQAINNIICDVASGLLCDGGVTGFRAAYNNFWNVTKPYDQCTAGDNDSSVDPQFVAAYLADFRLCSGSPVIAGGDPLEFLTANYLGVETSVHVGEVTNINAGDRFWITDGSVTETDVVASVQKDAVQGEGKFVRQYLTNDGVYLFTETSLADQQDNPERIDQGVFGNCALAGAWLFGDFESDHDVDGVDLATFAIKLQAGQVLSSDLQAFAGSFAK